jgi:hypothetical protein
MSLKKVVPESLTDAYKRREGDFAPDLVGKKITSSKSTLTLDNFGLTTNFGGRNIRELPILIFSEPITLKDLNITEKQSEDFFNYEKKIKINFDINNVRNYVYFGSFKEFVRVNIEDIVLNYPGFIFVNNYITSSLKNTVFNYFYDNLNDISIFNIPKTTIVNSYDVSYNDLGNYGVFYNNIYTPIISFTGLPNNDFITLKCTGDVFTHITSASTTFDSIKYFIKPNDELINNFYENLNDFQNFILNRKTNPKHVAKFDIPIIDDYGRIIYQTKTLVFPMFMNVGIDLVSGNYVEYLNQLIEISEEYDDLYSDILHNRYVSESIHAYDTINDEGGGKKMGKLLRVYGRNFDDIKKYIDGISFANVVTYNKKNNTSDFLIKSLAKTLGFDTIQTVKTNSLIEYIAKTNNSVFSGYSMSYSLEEVDTELWRRLVINAWWLYKSKGTRKVLEFLLGLFNIDECYLNFNEHVYLVEDKLKYQNVINELIKWFNLEDDDFESLETLLLNVPIDEEGFPRILPNSDDYYFQEKGFWYNGGNPSYIGNNPHTGPYDYGQSYFDKFRCFIDDFSGTTSTENELINANNLFEDYDNGDIENFEFKFSDIYAFIMNSNDKIRNAQIIKAGKTFENSFSGASSLKIRVNKNADVCDTINCSSVNRLDDSGLVIFNDNNNTNLYSFNFLSNKITLSNDTTFISNKICCENYGYEFLTGFINNIQQQLCFWCPPNINIINNFVVDTNNNTLSKKCCEKKGYTYDSNIKKCLNLKPDDFCNNFFIKETQEIIIDGNIANKTCCDKLKFTYVNNKCYDCRFQEIDGEIISVNLNTIYREECCTSLGYAYNEITKKCYKCPLYVITPNDEILPVTGRFLSQECCENLGFSFVNNRCFGCANVVDGDFIVNPNNNLTVSESCCQILGYVFKDGKCYNCPEYVINFPIVTQKSNNKDYSRDCCLKLGFTYDFFNKKCRVTNIRLD